MITLFKINSKTLTKNPSDVEQSKFRIEKTDRTINGTMIVDLVAIKDKVTFTWGYLTNTDLKKLIDELKTSTFVTVEYADPESQSLKSLIACSGDISYKPHYNGRLQAVEWKDIKVTFTEK